MMICMGTAEADDGQNSCFTWNTLEYVRHKYKVYLPGWNVSLKAQAEALTGKDPYFMHCYGLTFLHFTIQKCYVYLDYVMTI